MTAPAHFEGSCQCGRVRYRCSQAPLHVYICHCTECRKQSSSAFGISVQVPVSAFHVIEGQPQGWSRPTDSGATLDCWFCGDCGSRLWHRKRGAADTLNIKGGSLDSPLDTSDAVHIWTRSRLPGIVIPDHAREFLREPD